ncbi:MAG: hypothetical protein KDD11_13125 [Acidobacteria bacterium]|nr:hypothetical protein [Acidobacteriota bacterium]
MPALPRVDLRRGSLRLSRRVYDTYFAGLEAVILLPRDGALHILPVRHAGGGGYLLKQVNAAGDRTVFAGSLLRDLGVAEVFLEGDDERSFTARWSADHAALIVDPFP